MTDPLAQFAQEAAAFRSWALNGTDEGRAAATQAVVLVCRLLLAAHALPPAWSDDLDNEHDAERVDKDVWQTVLENAGRLPVDYYGDVLDALVIPPLADAVGIGSVSDDIADIYRDVVTGLEEYEAGRHAQALWEWKFTFDSHWGDHATGLIRAVQAWLSANLFDDC